MNEINYSPIQSFRLKGFSIMAAQVQVHNMRLHILQIRLKGDFILFE